MLFAPSYDSCAAWLLNSLTALGLQPFILAESEPHKPIVVAVWTGSEPSMPCILLNSHYDVVPAMQEHWSVPAFEGLVREGRIYGRGTQDMKCVCAQYIVALRKMRTTGYAPRRSIVLSFVPDEEIGGGGMKLLMTSAFFRSIKIGIALDEGLASESDRYSVFYGERLPWWVKIEATGNTGHGSRFIESTAVEQLIGVVNKALDFRQDQKDQLFGKGKHAGCTHAVAKSLGDVTSLNVTMLRSGVQSNGVDVLNVIPPLAEAAMDIRISPHVAPSQIGDMISSWCQDCKLDGGVVRWKFAEEAAMQHAVTSTDPAVNPWWKVFTKVLEEDLKIGCDPSVFPAATDSRFLRAMGIRAIGFSPMRRSPILLHEHDEYIDEAVYIEGCEVFVRLLATLGSQGVFEGFPEGQF